MNRSLRSVSWIFSFLIILGLLYFGYHHLIRQTRNKEANPFKYNLDAFKTVDPALIHYTELAPLKLNSEFLHAIAVDATNRMYIAVDRELRIYDDPAGPAAAVINMGRTVTCIAVSPTGSIYLGIGDHIEVFGSDGTRKDSWTSLGAKAQLTSIAIIGDHLFTADYGDRRVWHYDLTGKLLGSVESERADGKKGFIVPSPYFDVAAGNDSTLWAANPGEHLLENYSIDGKFIKSWGKPSMEISGFSGCCNPSHFIITSDNLFITGEKGLPRIKTYNIEGELVSVAAAPKDFAHTAYGCSGVAVIADIAVTSDGRILVLDRKSGCMRSFVKK